MYKVAESYDDIFESLRDAKPVSSEVDTANDKFFIAKNKIESDDEYDIILIEEYFEYREFECRLGDVYCDNFTYEDYLIEKKIKIKYDKNIFKDKNKYWCDFYGLDYMDLESVSALRLITSNQSKELYKHLGKSMPMGFYC